MTVKSTDRAEQQNLQRSAEFAKFERGKTKMRATRSRLLLLIGLMVAIGVSSALAAGGDEHKRPKNTGTLTIKTTERAYPVKIDGVARGLSGVGTPAEFYLTPGFHTVVVEGPNGAIFTKEIEIRKDSKVCICLKTVETVTKRPCPYNFHLDGPEKVMEGDQVIFAAINSGTAPIPIRYDWKVSPNNLKVVNGLGTPTITIDSTGMGGRTINAELDVNDDVYDNKCRQVISVPTEVGKVVIPEPTAYICDEFEAKNRDQDKARFDNCAIQVQNTPNSRLYVFIYPGTDKLSTSKNTYERTSKTMLDYMVKNLHLDPSRIDMIKGGTRERTTYQIWVVPPGAKLPVAR